MLCVIGVVLGRTQTQARTAGHLDAVSRTVLATVQPASQTVGRGLDGVTDFVGGIVNASALVERNRALESQAKSAALYDQTVALLRRDIDALRKSLNQAPVRGRTRIPASVVGYFPYENRITITIGKKQGIWPGLPVVTAEGLLGVVQVVEERISHVSLLSSPTLRVGAITDRDPAPAGLLHGATADVLIFELLDSKIPVSINDLVITSGFSENIPRGIPIGKVVQVEDDEAFGTRRAQVYPLAQIGNVRQVFVLR